MYIIYVERGVRMKKSTGARIEELRKSLGMEQKQVAMSVGVAAPVVSRWESDTKSPSRESICKLADLFNTTTDYLLCRTDEKAAVPSTILQDEAELLMYFKRLNAPAKIMALQMIKSFSADPQNQEEHLEVAGI